MLRSLRAAAVAGALFVVGCGISNTAPSSFGIYAPAFPIIHAYARNEIVCDPTTIGNLIGFAFGLPAMMLADAIRGPNGHDEPVVWSVVATPVLLFGAVFGTPFLPFSFLSRPNEHGCYLSM